MKIIHCADLHLDSKMTANLDKDKAKERKAELLNTYNNMVKYAVDNDVQAIIIAGDLFDTKNVSVTARNVVYNSIVNNPGIDFYYLKGNHDANSFLDNLETVPDNLKLFGEEWTEYNLGEKITITGVEISERNAMNIHTALTLTNDRFNIVVMHGQETEGLSVGKGETISIRNLKNKSIDYLALGHIHSYKMAPLDARGWYCYPGCLEGRGFDECGEHGFVLLSIDEENHKYETEFVKIACRNLYTISVNVSECMTSSDMALKIQEALKEGNYHKESLIKLVLTGEVDVECEKNTELLLKQFAPDFYFMKIYDETKLKVDYEAFALNESLKGEFVRKVIASDMSEEEKTIVIRYGIQALAGEEIQ